MAFQTPITIRQALGSIERSEYALPAIQRNFVWDHKQIAKLFDSLMRGYPIGSFLFWKVGRADIDQWQFYGFMLHYHQRDNKRPPALGALTRDEITAVLDGQQRLTAINIGLRGSYAYKLPRLWWNSPHAFPKRHLYLNVLAEADENEAGMQYDFRFLTKTEAAAFDETHCWYPVRDVLQAKDTVDLADFLIARELGNQRGPLKFLARLHQVVHTDLTIAHYEEDDRDLDKVLDIFIRTNSGGTPLSYSDMLLSMATAQWKNRDAREEVHHTVDEINRIGDGFGFSQEFMLKAGLMLADVGNLRFRVTNFNSDNMRLIEARWDRITHAVRTAVELVARFGFSKNSLTAHNAVLPIAHHLYRRGTPDGFVSHSTHRQDRGAIRIWLIRSLLKRGVWGSGLDTLLTALRKIIDAHGAEAFPSAHLETAMRARGKSLTFEKEELEDLVESKDRTFTLLSLLYPFPDVVSYKFHIDHVFPKSRFTPSRLLRAGVAKDDIPKFQDRADRLPNLQLLRGDANESKSNTLPQQWIAANFTAQEATEYTRDHDLGDVPADMTGFNAFYEARRDRLFSRLQQLLGTDQQLS